MNTLLGYHRKRLEKILPFIYQTRAYGTNTVVVSADAAIIIPARALKSDEME
jgi:hypothetical protein